MADDLRYIVPAPDGDTFAPVADIPVALARSRRVQGKLYEKHILNKGVLLHPKTGEKIRIDDAFVAAMQDNFTKGYCDIVQVPLANDKNEHVESPGANLGEVVGIRERAGKVYALIDARADAEKFGKTYLGASAYLSTNYTDSATNTKVGPTLLHVAVTNRPYVTGLEDYREVLAASADNPGEVVVLTAAPEETVQMTKDELLAALKDEHGIDVTALQAAAVPPAADSAALSAAIVSALQEAGAVRLAASDDPGQVSLSDVTAAVVELAQSNTSLRGEVDELKLAAAETEVDGYIGTGRLLPKAREVAVQMALTNRPGLDAIVAPADRPYVQLAAQKGVGGPDGEQRQEEDIDAEVARLTAQHAEFFTPDGSRK
jgi:type II secretory pathway component PulM